MTKPDFQTMSLPDLRAYILEHRQDDEAFYTFVDRRKAANPDRVSHQPPTTPEAMEEMRRAIESQVRTEQNRH